jgi:hypothetical protein
MASGNDMERFVTIFDSAFMLSGLALHRSLRRRLPGCRLWVIALDRDVERQLVSLSLDGLSVIPLREIESAELLAVKSRRSVGEYAWTLTPFAPQAVMARDPGATRVTYVDADLYFFDDPSCLFDEFAESGKSVLITPHAFAPEYDRSAKNGLFCVQFLVYRNNGQSREVLAWWQERCLEWCFARVESGKYGDQKYLDEWPRMFPADVHVLKQTHRTLAPWNVDYMQREHPAVPVFYHFQGLRILRRNQIKLYHGYRISSRHLWIYESYLAELRAVAIQLRQGGIQVKTMPEHGIALPGFRRLIMSALRKTRVLRLRPGLGEAP